MNDRLQIEQFKRFSVTTSMASVKINLQP